MSRVEVRQAEFAGLPGLRRQFEAWRARKVKDRARRFRRACGRVLRSWRGGAGRIALALGLDSHKLKQMSLGRWPVRRPKHRCQRRAS